MKYSEEAGCHCPQTSNQELKHSLYTLTWTAAVFDFVHTVGLVLFCSVCWVWAKIYNQYVMHNIFKDEKVWRYQGHSLPMGTGWIWVSSTPPGRQIQGVHQYYHQAIFTHCNTCLALWALHSSLWTTSSRKAESTRTLSWYKTSERGNTFLNERV